MLQNQILNWYESSERALERIHAFVADIIAPFFLSMKTFKSVYLSC